MIIYYLYIVYSLIISFFSNLWKKNNRKEILTFFLWLGLFIIMAFRVETVGNDIIRYLNHFESSRWINFFETSRETGYMIFLKVLIFLGVSKRGYLIIVSFLISAPISWFFFRYSKNVTLSFLFHFTIGIFAFTMSGIRQSIAISLTLFALHFALKRKLLPYLALIFIAINFHTSAIVFLPVYLLVNLKFKSFKPLIISLLFIVFIIIFNQKVFSFIDIFAPEKYIRIYLMSDDKSQLNILPVIFQFMLPSGVIFLWYWQKRKINNISKEELLFFYLTIIATVFTVLALNISALYRLSLYFTTCTMVLLSNVLSGFSNKTNGFIFKTIIIIICIANFIISTIGGRMQIDNYAFYDFF